MTDSLTNEGLPLSLCANKFWNRDKFKGSYKLSREKNLRRIPIEEKESYRWIESVKNSSELLEKNQDQLIHIADREGDIY
jgi:hypothetical protein